jgi:hypothetical protein
MDDNHGIVNKHETPYESLPLSVGSQVRLLWFTMVFLQLEIKDIGALWTNVNPIKT